MRKKGTIVHNTIFIYLALSLFIMAFFEIETAGIVPLKVFHISLNKGLYLLLISVATFGVLCPLTRFKICKLDTVSFFLLLKVLIDFSHYLLNPAIGDQVFWYFFSMVFVMPIIYMIFKSFTGDPKRIVTIISIFAIILVFQELLTAFYNGIPYNSDDFKTYMRIPVAHSNVIGVILLTILILNLKMYEVSFKTLVLRGIILLGLLLTQSRGCLIFLIGWLVFLKVGAKYSKYGKRVIPLIAIFILLLILVVIESSAIQNLLFDVSIKDKYLLSIATSGRYDIWELAWNQWFSNPFFGEGLGVTEYDSDGEIITTGVHNIILDYAVQSGLVGVFCYFVAVISGMRSKIKNDIPIRPALKLALWVMLVYSMFEVTYFNYSCFFLFWMMVGLYNSNILEYELHPKRINTNS